MESLKQKLDKIKANQQEINKIKSMFNGKLPESVMKTDYNRNIIDAIADDIRKNNLNQITDKYTDAGNNVSSKLIQKLAYLKGTASSNTNKVISKFHYSIATKLIYFYTEKNDTILDTFAGHNSRLQITYQTYRKYIGIDVSAEYMEFNEKVKNLLIQKQKESLFADIESITYDDSFIQLYTADSRYIDFIADASADFCLTSPPYWKQEYYTDEKEQLYNCNTYDEFLDELYNVVKQNYRILKNNKYAVFFVNDFRYKNKFIAYHKDFIDLSVSAGFELHDIGIVEMLASIRSAFTLQTYQTKILPKKHEYFIVLKKQL